MASTYSTLKVELIGTGDQTGTWGTTTNNNFSVALGEAITGSADVAFSSSDVTVTLTDTNSAQTARNLRLNLTGTSGGARNLILGSGCQIEKIYLVNNGLADAVTVKNTSGTGIAVAAGKSMFVYNNGTDVVDAITHLTSLTLGSALPVASGGTGITSLGTGVATWLGTPTSANLAAAVTDETGSGALVFATSPTLVTPVLGTPSSGVVTNLTGTASININGTVGASTASTGAFTTLGATGVATFSAGTASDPAITTTGDTNTGIFFPAADTIAFTEGGVECARFDSSANFQFNSGFGSVATAYGCRAWVNFNGTSTPAIRGSGNVTSITDNGTGNYTVNFTTSMPNVNYGTAGSVGRSFASTDGVGRIINIDRYATGSVGIRCGESATGTASDEPVICLSVFR